MGTQCDRAAADQIAPETARVISSVPPKYNAAARAAHVQGSVSIVVTINSKGAVTRAVAQEPTLPMGLTLAALESARAWRFEESSKRRRSVRLTFAFILGPPGSAEMFGAGPASMTRYSPALASAAIADGHPHPNEVSSRAELAERGTLCLAPFFVPGGAKTDPRKPPSPGRYSEFVFRVGGRVVATAGPDQLIAGRIPLGRTRLSILLDDEPFQEVDVDLEHEPGRRMCLMLFPDPWHWVDKGWKPEMGCRCPS